MPIAIYHLSIKIISRGKGKTAVAAAAYRAGETITNEYDGITHDYTRKGGIVHTEILLPNHAPVKYADRAVLWNAVEKVERCKTAQLAREIEIALPAELTREQNISLVRRYVKENFVNVGMCADVCIHDKGDGNPHVHIMLTLRPIEPDGTWGQKSRQDGKRKIPTVDWNERERAEDWRKAWANYCNTALRLADKLTEENTLDHRSYARQGVEQIPTVHMGVAAFQMEKRGIRTERGDMNRSIEVTNKELRQLRARLNKLNKWLAEEVTNTEPPTLADVITDILERRGQSGIARLKAAANMLIFLEENQITNLADLETKVSTMHSKVLQLGEDMKPVNRRIDTLKEHIRHSENYKGNRKVKRLYDALYAEYTATRKEPGLFAERKAQKALNTANGFYDINRAGLMLFDAADKYLRGVLQERFDPKKLPPIAMWREELSAKTAEREAMYREYQKLKRETQKVEQIRRNVTEIVGNETIQTEREIVQKRKREEAL